MANFYGIFDFSQGWNKSQFRDEQRSPCWKSFRHSPYLSGPLIYLTVPTWIGSERSSIVTLKRRAFREFCRHKNDQRGHFFFCRGASFIEWRSWLIQPRVTFHYFHWPLLSLSVHCASLAEERGQVSPPGSHTPWAIQAAHVRSSWLLPKNRMSGNKKWWSVWSVAAKTHKKWASKTRKMFGGSLCRDDRDVNHYRHHLSWPFFTAFS